MRKGSCLLLKIFAVTVGEATIQKVERVPLLASTITRQIDEIAEAIEEQLLEWINELPC